MRKKLMAGLESIDFQPNNFFVELTNLVSKLRKKTNTSNPEAILKTTECEDIKKCIKKFTNINVSFKASYYGFAVELPVLEYSSVLFDNDLRRAIQKQITEEEFIEKAKLVAKSKIKGSVNLKTGKVDGIFSDILKPIYLDVFELDPRGKMTDEEIAACILHEIGHIFTMMEYVTRSTITNQALSAMIYAIDQRVSLPTKEIVFKSLTDNIGLTKKELDAITKTTDKEMVTIVVMGAAARDCENELGFNLYDYTSAEYVADQYAARYGAGRALVTGLDKLEKKEKAGRKYAYFIMLASSLCYPLALGAPIYLLLISTISFISGYGITKVVRANGKDIYDDIKSRLIRVRLQNTERLKNSKLSKDEKRRFLDENKTINKIIDTYGSEKNIWEKIAYCLKPKYRKAIDIENLQKDLERFGGNKLFDSAAELTTI